MGNFKLVAFAAALASFGVLLIGAGSASATMMCIAKPVGTEELTCPEAGKNGYGVDVFPKSHIGGTLTGEATLELTGSGTVSCNESTFTMALTSNGTSKAGAGEGITATSFKTGGSNCTTEIGVNEFAAVTAENLSYDSTAAEYLGTGAPQGRVTIKKSSGSVQIKIVLTKSNTVCIYKPEGTLTGNWNNAAGGKQSQLVFSGAKFEKVSGEGCTAAMRLTATYNLKAELAASEIYIAGK